MRISERLSRHRIKPAPVPLDGLAHSNLTGLEDIGGLVRSQEERNVDHGTDDAQKFKEEGEQEEEVRMYILDLDGNQS